MTELSVRQWSIEDWLGSEAAWSALLSESPADRLFLSWDWLTLWWQHFGAARGYRPHILAFYRNDRLVGAAPFYRTRVLRRSILPAHSIQFIGLSWRDTQPLISEYLDVVAARDEVATIRSACLQSILSESGWTEMVIGYTEVGEAWRADLAVRPGRNSHYVREMDHTVSYQADLNDGLETYLRSLGQSSRRSIWNLRRRLELHGPVHLERVGAAEIAAGFRDLNRLHALRWNRPAFTGARLRFHEQLAARLACRDELAMTRLRVGGRVVSVLYDIRKGSQQYNIKLGFDPAFDPRVSVGLLHLGYALESAAQNNVHVYDFLAGRGLKTDYKRNLSQTCRKLNSIQVLRGRVLPPLYRWHDRLRGTAALWAPV